LTYLKPAEAMISRNRGTWI